MSSYIATAFLVILFSFVLFSIIRNRKSHQPDYMRLENEQDRQDIQWGLQIKALRETIYPYPVKQAQWPIWKTILALVVIGVLLKALLL